MERFFVSRQTIEELEKEGLIRVVVVTGASAEHGKPFAGMVDDGVEMPKDIYAVSPCSDSPTPQAALDTHPFGPGQLECNDDPESYIPLPTKNSEAWAMFVCGKICLLEYYKRVFSETTNKAGPKETQFLNHVEGRRSPEMHLAGAGDTSGQMSNSHGRLDLNAIANTPRYVTEIIMDKRPEKSRGKFSSVEVQQSSLINDGLRTVKLRKHLRQHASEMKDDDGKDMEKRLLYEQKWLVDDASPDKVTVPSVDFYKTLTSSQTKTLNRNGPFLDGCKLKTFVGYAVGLAKTGPFGDIIKESTARLNAEKMASMSQVFDLIDIILHCEGLLRHATKTFELFCTRSKDNVELPNTKTVLELMCLSCFLELQRDTQPKGRLASLKIFTGVTDVSNPSGNPVFASDQAENLVTEKIFLRTVAELYLTGKSAFTLLLMKKHQKIWSKPATGDAGRSFVRETGITATEHKPMSLPSSWTTFFSEQYDAATKNVIGGRSNRSSPSPICDTLEVEGIVSG